ncbi:MAG TPA: hypothetical protein VF278_04640 [Pirellulales bacterium]
MAPFYPLIIGMLAIVLAHSLCALTCLVRIFTKGEVGMGCACFIPIIGPFVLFFYSWSKAEEWQQQRLMVAFSVVMLAQILFGIILSVLMIKEGIAAVGR